MSFVDAWGDVGVEGEGAETKEREQRGPTRTPGIKVAQGQLARPMLIFVYLTTDQFEDPMLEN